MRQAGDRIPRPPVRRKPAPRPPTRRQPHPETFGPVKAPGFQGAQRQAAKKERKAATRVQRPVLPSFPLLPKYTPAQKRAIVGAHSKAINKQRQPGETSMDVVRRLHETGDAQTRQALKVLGRALGPRLTPAQARTQARRVASHAAREPGAEAEDRAGWPADRGVEPVALPAVAGAQRDRGDAPGEDRGFYGSRIVNDAVSLPRNTVLSGYLLGRAGVKAAQGHPEEAKSLAHQFVRHDPLALLAQGKFREAAIAGGEHPLSTALELGGLRAGGASLAKLTGTSLEREARTLPGTSLVEERRYGHPLSKVAARKLDARRTRKYDERTARGRQLEAQGHEEAAQEQFRKAGRPPSMVSDRYIEHRADVTEGMSQPGRRRGRAEVSQAYRGTRKQEGMLVPVGQGGHLEREIATGTVPAKVLENGRVDVADLRVRLGDRAEAARGAAGAS
jgi:hypothetical protein